MYEGGFALKADALWATDMVKYNHWSRTFEYQWVMDNAYITKDDVVLNAGCGDYASTPFNRMFAFNVSFKELVLLDYDDVAIKDLEQLKMFAHVLLVKGDIAKINYPDEYFTKIFCISVLEHSDLDIGVYLKEMMRVLKVGGKLLITMDVGADGAESVAKYNMSNIKSIMAGWGVDVPDVPSTVMCRVIDNRVPIQILCISITKEKEK
jgi:SAM-dependent methyltransferase